MFIVTGQDRRGGGGPVRGDRCQFSFDVAGWVLLTCGSPLADGVVIGHGLSFKVADFRGRESPGPVADVGEPWRGARSSEKQARSRQIG
jgi:hypothetical protein